MSDSNPYGPNTGGPQQGAGAWTPSYPQYSSDGTPEGTAGQPYQQYPGQEYPAGQYGQQAQPYVQNQPYGQAQPYYGQPGVSPYGQPGAPAERKWSGMAIVGFVIAVVALGISLFSGVVVLAILPIALCARALVDVKQHHKKGKVLAIVGLVVACLSAVLYIINIAGS